MKLAIHFPGIGYHVDKPLLYFSRKIAKQKGFDIIDVNYGGFDLDIKGDKEKMKEAFLSALSQAEKILSDVDFTKYEDVVLFSKSVGTAVAGAYAIKHGISSRNVFFTPVEQSFDVMKQPGIVFHGSSDPWLSHDIFMKKIKETDYPYYVIENANHSLETGDVDLDIENLAKIMKAVEEYI